MTGTNAEQQEQCEAVGTLLRAIFAEDSSDVDLLAGGAFSRAYGFTSGGMEYVVRVNNAAHASEGFAKDDYAARHFGSSALPIPRVALTGTTPDGQAWFAVSELAHGRTLQESTPAECRAALPALLDTIDTIARVDVSASAGFGPWCGGGDGEFESWRGYLASVIQNDAGGYYQDWHRLFHDSFLERDVYERVYGQMLRLLERCPERRALIHNDLWLDASNLLVDHGRVTGVIDWSNGLYGDPLYEVARILWGTNWPGWWDAADVALVAARYQDTPGYGTRLVCYQLHIGLDDLRYYAKNGRREDYDRARTTLVKLCAV